MSAFYCKNCRDTNASHSINLILLICKNIKDIFNHFNYYYYDYCCYLTTAMYYSYGQTVAVHRRMILDLNDMWWPYDNRGRM